MPKACSFFLVVVAVCAGGGGCSAVDTSGLDVVPDGAGSDGGSGRRDGGGGDLDAGGGGDVDAGGGGDVDAGGGGDVDAGGGGGTDAGGGGATDAGGGGGTDAGGGGTDAGGSAGTDAGSSTGSDAGGAAGCTSPTECDDGIACTADLCLGPVGSPRMCVNRPIDVDADTYVVEVPGSSCGNDCNDGVASVNPGQRMFFARAIPASATGGAGGGYDYDCNGVEERERTTAGRAAGCMGGAAGCTGSGWIGGDGAIPECGATGTFQECHGSGTACSGATSMVEQRCR